MLKEADLEKRLRWMSFEEKEKTKERYKRYVQSVKNNEFLNNYICEFTAAMGVFYLHLQTTLFSYTDTFSKNVPSKTYVSPLPNDQGVILIDTGSETYGSIIFFTGLCAAVGAAYIIHQIKKVMVGRK